MEEYNICPLIKNNRLLTDIRTGMYSLPQSGRLAYIKLVRHLSTDGYIPTDHTPGLFYYITGHTTFNLVVDNFGVKVLGKTHANHLINNTKKNNDVIIDGDDKIFFGIHLK